MTNPKLLLPLRVPEVGPYLGKLVTGTGRIPAGLRLDAVRYRLVTRVIESAGEARRLAGRDDRSAAVAAVGRSVWFESWEEAVNAVTERVAAHVGARLVAQARAVRMPRRVRRQVEIDAPERRAITARFGSAGAALIPALDALEEASGPAQQATPLERSALERWQTALKTAAQRLEGAWLALEDAVEEEVDRWNRLTTGIAAWRRSLWPVAVGGAVLLSAATWLGLVMGGYLSSPPWLTRLWQAVFGP